MPDREVAARRGAVFVGRQAELRALIAALDAALDGRGSLALVTATAGMGKTRLAVEAARYAEQAGGTVSWGHGRPESAAPLGPWREALRPIAATPFDGLAPGGPTDREGLFEAVASSIEVAARRAPLTLVLEDLHWADELSVLQLAWLRPRLAHLPIMVIATSRQPLAPVGRPDLDVRLQGLTESEIAALLGAQPGSGHFDAGDLRRRTGGNPLFLLEVARSGAGGVPASVADVVRQRLEPLAPAARAAVDVASVLGDSFDLDVLAATAGVPVAEMSPAVDAAASAGFLVEEPDRRRFRFEHDLVRQAVYDGVERSTRRSLHAAVAAALARWPRVEPADVANHLLAAGAAAPSEQLARWTEEAAHRAGRLFAHTDAARWLDHARRALGTDHPRSLELLLLAADARWRAGARDDAWAAYEEAAAEAERRRDFRALALAALGFGGGRAGFEVPPTHDIQKRLLFGALEALPRHEHALRALLLSRLSITLSFAHQPDRQRQLASRAVEEARRSGDTGAVVTALASWCDAHGGPEHLQERLRVVAEMVEAAASTGDPELELLGLRFQIVAFLELGNRTATERAIGRFAALAERLRQPAISFYVPMFAATLAIADGRLEDADRRNREAAEIGSRAGSVNALMLTSSQRCALRLLQGRAAEIEGDIRGVVEAYPEVSGPHAGMAMVDAHLGRAAAARARLDRLRAGGFSTFPVDAEWLAALATLADAAVLSDHRTVAEELLALLTPYRGQFVVDGIGACVVSTVSLSAARLAALVDDLALADVLFAEAIEDCRRFGAPLLLATAAFAWSQTFAGRDPERARELASVAEAIVADLGLASSALRPLPHLQQRVPLAPAVPAPPPVPQPPAADAATAATAAFRREGEFWTLRWRDEETRVRDTKGMRYLRELVGRPHREIHVLDLAGGGTGPDRPDGDLGPVLDERARREYRRRLADLQEDIDEAEAAHDVGRAGVLKVELDELVRQISAATGLGGRERRPGSAAERARVNVTKSIKQALDRIEAALPALGHHLRTTVRTGTFCAYEPDPTAPPVWELR